MRFRGGELVFHRMKIRYKTANVAEINVEKLEEVSRHLESPSREWFSLGTFLISSPDRDSEAKLVSTI